MPWWTNVRAGESCRESTSDGAGGANEGILPVYKCASASEVQGLGLSETAFLVSLSPRQPLTLGPNRPGTLSVLTNKEDTRNKTRLGRRLGPQVIPTPVYPLVTGVVGTREPGASGEIETQNKVPAYHVIR